ncbi:MAG: hypothetical protein J6T79_03230, partial [Verrucomicrobia bacterium]|nr:hypothetical protein [Verrucomicrobiota bacterium]
RLRLNSYTARYLELPVSKKQAISLNSIMIAQLGNKQDFSFLRIRSFLPQNQPLKSHFSS